MAVIATCREMKQPPAERKGSSFIRHNLKQTLKEVKEVVKIADSFFKRTTSKAEGHVLRYFYKMKLNEKLVHSGVHDFFTVRLTRRQQQPQ